MSLYSCFQPASLTPHPTPLQSLDKPFHCCSILPPEVLEDAICLLNKFIGVAAICLSSEACGHSHSQSNISKIIFSFFITWSGQNFAHERRVWASVEMTISKRCDVPSCFLFVVVAGVCACMHACVCVREPVVCFCFEDGITCVKYENLR